MAEVIYNLFYFVENGVVSRIGVKEHFVEGDDQFKIEYLQSRIAGDAEDCRIYPIPKSLLDESGQLHHDRYESMVRIGKADLLYEGLLADLKAKEYPFRIATAIVNGEPICDIRGKWNELLFLTEPREKSTGESGPMEDYLKKYLTENRFDAPSLLYDDHLSAVKELFNKKHYLSCMKLLVSFIDTVAYLEFGDKSKNFLMWLDKYAGLSDLGIYSEELWELRNSILHMSNLDSKRVLSGKVRRIGFFVGPIATPTRFIESDVYFNLIDLIHAVHSAMEKWLHDICRNPEKMASFVARYDRVIRTFSAESL